MQGMTLVQEAPVTAVGFEDYVATRSVALQRFAYLVTRNAEDARDLAGALEIQSIPTIMGFKDGKLVFRQSGLLSGKQLDSLIEQIAALEV